MLRKYSGKYTKKIRQVAAKRVKEHFDKYRTMQLRRD